MSVCSKNIEQAPKSPQLRLVGRIVGLRQQLEFAVFVYHADGRVLHPVEEGGLHHGVVNHVVEYDAVAHL